MNFNLIIKLQESIHMKKWLVLLFYCQVVKGQTLSDSVNIDGIYRSFHFEKPNEKSKGYSLLFILHGSGGSGPQMMQRVTSFKGKTDQEKVIVVFPSGYKNFWNECRKMSPALANVNNVNEEKFFLSMIAYFQKKYKTDKNKVFAIGTSGGGHMVYKLGLTIPESFRAVTALIANLPEQQNLDCSEMNKPMNIMIVNGTDDKTNPYNGGDVILASGNFGAVRSTDKTFTYWSGLAGYDGAPTSKKLPDTNPNDGKTIEEYRYSGKEKEIVLLKVIGGKHDYPGDIDVHWYAWEFFKSKMN
jgi:polyhydroxybutyrate depolymerase